VPSFETNTQSWPLTGRTQGPRRTGCHTRLEGDMLLSEVERDAGRHGDRVLEGNTISADRATTLFVAAPRASTGERPFPWIASSQTPAVFTMCTASGNGARMSGTRITKARQRTGRRGSHRPVSRPSYKAPKQAAAPPVAVPRTPILSTSARPPAAGSPLATGTATWVSGLGGRLPLNSSPHYLVGPGGDALGRNRTGGWAMPDQSIHDGYSKRMILVKPSFA